jgi:hypothetical protein
MLVSHTEKMDGEKQKCIQIEFMLVQLIRVSIIKTLVKGLWGQLRYQIPEDGEFG